VGGPDCVDYSSSKQVVHSSPDDFAADLKQVWRNAFAIASSGAKLVIRFGGITDRRANPLDLLRSSLTESGWQIKTIRAAGSAMAGKRQAETFLRKRSSA
jgi:hypothetical protein